jgi:hypothetical protein
VILLFEDIPQKTLTKLVNNAVGHLVDLNLSFCPVVDDNLVKVIVAKYSSNLKRLSLAGCKITDAAFSNDFAEQVLLIGT